jgi:hypothetical protein
MTTIHEDYIELQVVYGFLNPTAFNLDDTDTDWLQVHCDAAAYARRESPIPRGLWLREGFVVEAEDTVLVSVTDCRAVATGSGPVLYRFMSTRGGARGSAAPRQPMAPPATPGSSRAVLG